MPTPAVHFDPQASPVNKILLVGQASPGIAVVRGATDVRKFDIQTGPYLAGGITIYRGREPSRFTVDLYLLSASDWDNWFAWKPLVARPPFGKFPKAMRIQHPWLAMLEISEVQVEKVHQPEPDDDTGGYVITIEFLEYRLPKIALAKPVAAETKPDNDPYNKIIENLTKQLDVLAK